MTGGTRGIGLEIASQFLETGAEVYVTGTKKESDYDHPAFKEDRFNYFRADFTNNESLDRLAAFIAGLGKLDVLVNNAGITRDGLMMRMKDEDWDAVMDVNLKAAMILSRSVMRPMMKNRWGRIIQISSIVGYTGNPGQANYAAAKAGMAGFTKALAAEGASRGITANMIAPGFIRTPMTDALTDDQKTALLGNVPADRLGEAEEIAAAVVYLASPQSGYTTGATMHINGGMAML